MQPPDNKRYKQNSREYCKQTKHNCHHPPWCIIVSAAKADDLRFVRAHKWSNNYGEKCDCDRQERHHYFIILVECHFRSKCEGRVTGLFFASAFLVNAPQGEQSQRGFAERGNACFSGYEGHF